jgi:uncharacterized protein (UPF0254 family)
MKHSPKYEILDSMEVTVATADCFTDALYVAEKHDHSMIYSTAKQSVVWANYRNN